jgi:hypothetical protein
MRRRDRRYRLIGIAHKLIAIREPQRQVGLASPPDRTQRQAGSH